MSSVLVTSVPDVVARPAERRKVQTLERRMIADVVRRRAERHLPAEFALVEIDGGDPAVGRLDQRQALHGEPAAAATFAAAAAAADRPPPLPRCAAPATAAGAPAPRCAGARTGAAGRRAPDSTVPWKYGRSDAPGGGGTSPSVAIDGLRRDVTPCASPDRTSRPASCGRGLRAHRQRRDRTFGAADRRRREDRARAGIATRASPLRRAAPA